MSIGGRGFLFVTVLVIAGASLCAQADAPSFTPESVVPSWKAHAQSLMPGDLVSIYGRHLAPAGGCARVPPPQNGNYPTEACATRVTVNGIRAGLLAVLENQINLKIPAAAPTSGKAPIVVTVGNVSSPPVMVSFGKPKVILSLAGPAYVHMPVWIALDRPLFGNTAYPYSVNPENFGGGRFEVRRNGVMLKPIEIRHDGEPGGISGLLNGSVAPAGALRGRLPLHLQYRYDVPGKYEVRFIGTKLEIDRQHGIRTVPVDGSDWTEIEILPYSAGQRRKWIQEQIAKMPSSPGLLVGDAIPGLLAFPDELALSAILPGLYHPDPLVRSFTLASLRMFDSALVAKTLTPMIREKGPSEEIARLLDFREELFEGGHRAFVALLPRFLMAASPEVQAGALQYMVWEQNHPWGKTPESQAQRNAVLLRAAPRLLQRGDPRTLQLLAEALGSVKTDGARELLWKMIESGKAEEQSKIALTWIGDPRDLPRLAALLIAPAANPYGRENAAIPYSLHRAWGDAALPWLKQAARDSKQVFVRTSSAKELVLANQPEGFADLLQEIDERPPVKAEALQFLRDRFPGLRHASEEDVLAFLKSRAGTQ